MGTIPSAAISSVAIHETARLDDHEEKYPAAFVALSEQTYVDNTFVTGPNHQKVRADIAEIEIVAQKGGFFFKEWIISGEKVPEQFIAVHLPNQISAEEERAFVIQRYTLSVNNILVKIYLGQYYI